MPFNVGNQFTRIVICARVYTCVMITDVRIDSIPVITANNLCYKLKVDGNGIEPSMDIEL